MSENTNNKNKNNKTTNTTNTTNAPPTNTTNLTNNSNNFNKFDIDLSNVSENTLNMINKNTKAETNPELAQMENNLKRNKEIRNNIKERGQELKKQAQETTEQIKNTVENTTKKVKKGIENTTDKIRTNVGSLFGIDTAVKKKTKSNNNSNNRDSEKITKKKSTIMASLLTVLKFVLITALLVGLILLGYKLLFKKVKSDGVTLLDKAIEGDKPMVISQDPDNENHVLIRKSENQKFGIEFTYSFWIILSSLEKNGQWKHVFHKGNKTSYPDRCPGVWIHPNTNDLRIYLNTQNDPLSFLDVKNIPMKKWVNVTITFKQGKTGTNTMLNNLDDNLPNTVDVFVNGLLKSTKSFDTTPKLNDGDFWINMFGGFDGLIGKIKYFSRCVNFEKIQELVDDCPNDHTCGIDAVCPPYLDTDYWFS